MNNHGSGNSQHQVVEFIQSMVTQFRERLEELEEEDNLDLALKNHVKILLDHPVKYEAIDIELYTKIFLSLIEKETKQNRNLELLYSKLIDFLQILNHPEKDKAKKILVQFPYSYLTNVCAVYRYKKDYHELEWFYKHKLEDQRENNAESHEIYNTRKQLAKTYILLNQLDDAERLFTELYKESSDLPNSEPDEKINLKYALGHIYFVKKQYGTAKKFLEGIYKTLSDQGVDHGFWSSYYLIFINKEFGEYKEAEKLCIFLIRKYGTIYGYTDDRILLIMVQQAEVYEKLNKMEHALDKYSEICTLSRCTSFGNSCDSWLCEKMQILNKELSLIDDKESQSLDYKKEEKRKEYSNNTRTTFVNQKIPYLIDLSIVNFLSRLYGDIAYQRRNTRREPAIVYFNEFPITQRTITDLIVQFVRAHDTLAIDNEIKLSEDLKKIISEDFRAELDLLENIRFSRPLSEGKFHILRKKYRQMMIEYLIGRYEEYLKYLLETKDQSQSERSSEVFNQRPLPKIPLNENETHQILSKIINEMCKNYSVKRIENEKYPDLETLKHIESRIESQMKRISQEKSLKRLEHIPNALKYYGEGDVEKALKERLEDRKNYSYLLALLEENLPPFHEFSNSTYNHSKVQLLKNLDSIAKFLQDKRMHIKKSKFKGPQELNTIHEMIILAKISRMFHVEPEVKIPRLSPTDNNTDADARITWNNEEALIEIKTLDDHIDQRFNIGSFVNLDHPRRKLETEVIKKKLKSGDVDITTPFILIYISHPNSKRTGTLVPEVTAGNKTTKTCQTNNNFFLLNDMCSMLYGKLGASILIGPDGTRRDDGPQRFSYEKIDGEDIISLVFACYHTSLTEIESIHYNLPAPRYTVTFNFRKRLEKALNTPFFPTQLEG